MSETTFAVLEPPRHRCLACGTCCTGTFIEVDDDEVARIEAAGRALGVTDPLENGGLRMHDGQCVFLGDDRLCTIHGRLGATVKPLRCQQYPFVAVHTEAGPRAGIDPACGTAWQTWRDGPLLDPGQVAVRTRRLPPDQLAAEAAFVRAAAPGATVAGLLHLLCTGRPGSALPEGLEARWLSRLQAADLRAVLDDPKTGRGIRTALADFPDAIAALDAPPARGLPPALDAWAVETARRMVFLRLAPLVPVVQGVALLSLLGAVACGWVHPEPARFGPAFAAWSRWMRWRAVWQALAPDPATMSWLATGR